MATVNAEPREIALLSESLRALAEANTLDEIKDIRDKAEAMRLYVKQRGEGLEIQNLAAEVKIRAERRAGVLLLDMEISAGRPSADKWFHDGTISAPTLNDLGIDKKQSHRWQKIASVPAEAFEQHIEETKSSGKELTSASVYRLADKPEPCEPQDWTLDEAIEALGSRCYQISQKWPKDRLSVMSHQLRSLADELEAFGELRE